MSTTARNTRTADHARRRARLLRSVDREYVTWDGDESRSIDPLDFLRATTARTSRSSRLTGRCARERGRPRAAAPSPCRRLSLARPPTPPPVSHRDADDRRTKCTSDIDAFASDYVVVEGRSVYRPWFAVGPDRAGGQSPRTRAVRFATRGPAVSRPVRARAGSDQRVLALAPRDGHVSGRSHLGRPGAPSGRGALGSTPGGRPGTEGIAVHLIDPMPTYTWGEEDPFYINLRCRSRPAPGAEWAYSYPTAVTDDGTTWHSFPGCRDGGPSRTRRCVPWQPRLSVEPRRRAARRSAFGCDVQVQLAHPGDSVMVGARARRPRPGSPWTCASCPSCRRRGRTSTTASGTSRPTRAWCG